MYLVAQRVVAPRREMGVNVFQYVHGCPFNPVQLQSFNPELNPGELVQQWVEVPPGGNHVISFLDVAATDEIDRQVLFQSLGALKYVLKRVDDQTQATWGPLWIWYGHQPNLRVPWETELARGDGGNRVHEPSCTRDHASAGSYSSPVRRSVCTSSRNVASAIWRGRQALCARICRSWELQPH